MPSEAKQLQPVPVAFIHSKPLHRDQGQTAENDFKEQGPRPKRLRHRPGLRMVLNL